MSSPGTQKSGRLEFYRPEPEFIDSGENILIYREPIDSTFHEPNVIVAKAHPALRPKQAEAYGLRRDDLSTETRQVRHVLKTVDELMISKHPLMAQGYKHIYHTPKYRHGAHTTPVDTDFTGVLFGPSVTSIATTSACPRSPRVHGHKPSDAKELGLDDGDYVWVDADPRIALPRLQGRNRGVQSGPAPLARAYVPGDASGRGANLAQHVRGELRERQGHETRSDGLAKNPETNYQAMYRYGSHQSATARLAEADSDDGDACPQGHVRSIPHEGIPRGRSLPSGGAKRGVRQANQGRARRYERRRAMASGGAWLPANL